VQVVQSRMKLGGDYEVGMYADFYEAAVVCFKLFCEHARETEKAGI